MNNSKLYNMAAKIAVDKLAPKPIHIAISMQGGGSLSSIELPVIKRVSGGDIGDYGSFIGGYTDADAGVGATVSDTFYGDTSTDDGIHIAISMQGGGGISSLNENIIYRQGGGGAEFGMVGDVVSGVLLGFSRLWRYRNR